MRQRQVRTFVAGAAAAAAMVAMAAPAGADPTHSPSSLTFENVECLGLVGQPALVTDFVVVGNGNGIAHTGAGIFTPIVLDVTVNGEAEPTVQKGNPDNAEWECSGTTSFDTPGGPVTISFVADGVFHP
jgi:hypothetical protein